MPAMPMPLDSNGLTAKVQDAIKTVGFPIVMVFVFIAWEAGWLPSQSREMIHEMRGHNSATKDLTAAIMRFEASSKAQVLLTSCLAYARTSEVQQKCLDQYQGGGR